jgi:hypothetical protein
MTTVNWLATIQMPCPTPLLTPDGSKHDELCCGGVGMVDGWLVGPWDGEPYKRPHQMPRMDRATLGPPADLVALTEACQTCDGEGGWTDSIDIHTANGYGGQTIDHPCPDCIDGHPAVEVVQYGEDSFGYNIRTLGRGTIRPDHILPVLGEPDWDDPTDHTNNGRFIYRSQDSWWYFDGHVPQRLDIDVSPGQFVAIVTPEAT